MRWEDDVKGTIHVFTSDAANRTKVFSNIEKECRAVDLFTNKNDDLFMECKQNICRPIKIILGIVRQDTATVYTEYGQEYEIFSTILVRRTPPKELTNL